MAWFLLAIILSEVIFRSAGGCFLSAVLSPWAAKDACVSRSGSIINKTEKML
jgi:hypothetical protein